MRNDEQETKLKQLGDYEILERCGRGANAVVYRARQRSLDRIVAVKVLLKTHEEKESVRHARFVREARLAAQLRHPNAVQIIEAGTHQGLAFVAMEWLDGHDLRDELALHAPLTLEGAARFGRDIANALRAAHRQGIVHRDLKPANVMITRNDEEARAVVIDFGLARSANPTADASLTCENTMLGTPSYMSPETIRGDHTHSASDIYALGIMLLEMLTGANPWRSASALETVSRHLHPEVRSEALLLLRDYPPSLRALIAAMLAADPDTRPDASGVLNALAPWVGGTRERATQADALACELLADASESPHSNTPLGDHEAGAVQAASTGPRSRRDKKEPGMTRSSRIALVAACLFICALFVTLVALSTQRGTRRLQASNPKLETSGIASTSAVPAPRARGERPTRARASHLQQTTQAPWLWLSPDSSLAHDVWTYTGTRNAESAEGIDGRTAARNLSTSQPNHREPSLSVASDEQDEGGHREVAPARDDATPRSTEPERGTGSLTVIAATPGELLIDGVTYGERSALVVPRLPVGRHRVELRSGGSTSVREVDIRRGHRRMLRLAFDEAESATSSDALTQNP